MRLGLLPFAFIIIFITPKVMACPDLAGTYVCNNGQGKSEIIEIQQEKINESTIYSIRDSQGLSHLPTDNVEYPFENQNNGGHGSARFYCDPQGFHSQIKGQKSNAKGLITESWDLTQTLSRSADGDLTTTLQGQLTLNGQVTPVLDTHQCQQMN